MRPECNKHLDMYLWCVCVGGVCVCVPCMYLDGYNTSSIQPGKPEAEVSKMKCSQGRKQSVPGFGHRPCRSQKQSHPHKTVKRLFLLTNCLRHCLLRVWFLHNQHCFATCGSGATFTVDAPWNLDILKFKLHARMAIVAHGMQMHCKILQDKSVNLRKTFPLQTTRFCCKQHVTL